MVHRILSATLVRYSLWWSAGSDRVEPSFLFCEGLPDAEGFGALLDGQWRQWGWSGEDSSNAHGPGSPRYGRGDE